MESLKIWIISLCSATVISSIFKSLIENSTLKKTVNIFLSLFVLFYTIIPIAKISFNTPADIDESTDNFNAYYIDGYENIIKLSIENECERLSVKMNDFQIKSSLDNDNNIVIEELKVVINDSSKADELKEQIKKNLGYEVTVN